jgi:hypothetical protein
MFSYICGKDCAVFSRAAVTSKRMTPYKRCHFDLKKEPQF